MKLIIDIDEEKYEWIKKNNPNIDINSIVGAVANGKPFVQPLCPLDYPTEDDPYPICPVSEAKWIPVSERLPDYSDGYVVTRGEMCHRFMDIVAFDAVYKNWDNGGVVAWIDAKPYKGCGE